MRRLITIALTALLSCGAAMAQEQRVLVVKTVPDAANTEVLAKIKNNIRFTPGVKRIDTDAFQGVVAITYDSDRLDKKTLLAAFKKIGCEATEVSDKVKEKKKKDVDGKTGATVQSKK